MGLKQGRQESAVWTRELNAVLLEGIEANELGSELAHQRLKALHPLPPGKLRYSSDFEKWLKKVFERDSSAAGQWLTAEFWHKEVDRVLIEGIFGRVPNDELIGRILLAWPKLDAQWLIERLEEVARIGLPHWVYPDFWATQIDPVLLSGIRNAIRCEREAVETVQKAFPELETGRIWARLRRLQRERRRELPAPPAIRETSIQPGLSAAESGKPELNTTVTSDAVSPSRSTDEGQWVVRAHPILVDTMREANRLERASVKKVLNKFPELRVGAIWTRLRQLRRQQGEEGHTGVPYRWTADLDERLVGVHAQAGLRAAANEIEGITGWPRKAILRRARKLGLPRQAIGSRERWTMVELRFAIESASHTSVREIAEEIGRSEKAVWTMISRRGIEGRFQEGYSLRELGEKLHVRRKTVGEWVKSGLLRRKKNGRVAEESLQAFLYSHPEEIRATLLDEDTASWISQLVEAEKTRLEAFKMRSGAKRQRSVEARGASGPNQDETVSSAHESDPFEDPASQSNQAHGASPGQ